MILLLALATLGILGLAVLALIELRKADTQGEHLGGYLGPDPDVWCGLAERDRRE